MTAAMGCRSQTNNLGPKFDWAVIGVFGDVVEGGVYRHESKSISSPQGCIIAAHKTGA